MSDELLQRAMIAQTAALVFIAKDPVANMEKGMLAYHAAQRIIDRWDQEQIDAMKNRSARPR